VNIKQTPFKTFFDSQTMFLPFQQSSSNESQLVLSSVTPATSGKFSCEVSADFPSFHTNIVSGDMEVVGKSSKNSRIKRIKLHNYPNGIVDFSHEKIC
jgi:hypothetical protein